MVYLVFSNSWRTWSALSSSLSYKEPRRLGKKNAFSMANIINNLTMINIQSERPTVIFRNPSIYKSMILRKIPFLLCPILMCFCFNKENKFFLYNHILSGKYLSDVKFYKENVLCTLKKRCNFVAKTI